MYLLILPFGSFLINIAGDQQQNTGNNAMTSFPCQFEVMKGIIIHYCIKYTSVFYEIMRQVEANVVDRARGGKRARTREKLISAAAAIIGEKGYDRAPLEEIASRAGMTRGAVYGNFKNKEELSWPLLCPDGNRLSRH